MKIHFLQSILNEVKKLLSRSIIISVVVWSISALTRRGPLKLEELDIFDKLCCFIASPHNRRCLLDEV